MKNSQFTIGIDAGTNTGIAVFDSLTKKIIKTHSTDFFGCFKFMKTLERENVRVIVEVPSDFIYSRNSRTKGGVRDKMAILIGGVRRESQLIAKGLRILGFDVEEVLPVRARKWTADELERHTGYAERTNEHTRDAARIAFFHSG